MRRIDTTTEFDFEAWQQCFQTRLTDYAHSAQSMRSAGSAAEQAFLDCACDGLLRSHGDPKVLDIVRSITDRAGFGERKGNATFIKLIGALAVRASNTSASEESVEGKEKRISATRANIASMMDIEPDAVGIDPELEAAINPLIDTWNRDRVDALGTGNWMSKGVEIFPQPAFDTLMQQLLEITYAQYVRSGYDQSVLESYYMLLWRIRGIGVTRSRKKYHAMLKTVLDRVGSSSSTTE